LFRNTNFCIQIMWQKGSTFLAIVDLHHSHRSPEKVFYLKKNPYNLLAVYDLILVYCIIARMSSFSGQCERLSRRLVVTKNRIQTLKSSIMSRGQDADWTYVWHSCQISHCTHKKNYNIHFGNNNKHLLLIRNSFEFNYVVIPQRITL
jgi:hypothetical protein